MIEAIAEVDDEVDARCIVEERRDLGGSSCARRCAGRRSPAGRCRCWSARRSRTRASSRCSTRWSTTCRRRPTCPPVAGHGPDGRAERIAAARRRRAVLGAGVQDHERPVRRVADLLPRLLRQGRVGATVYNATKGKRERIGRLLRMHANKREDVKEVTCGNIAAAVGLRVTTTGDTLCDEKAPVVLELMDFPAPVIVDRRSSPKTQADQDKLAHGAGEAGDRGPVVPRQDRPRDRADHHLGDGRAAPRDHRRPAGARVQGRGQRRPAAGRLPRDDRARRRGRGQVHPPDRRPRASTATSRCTSSRPTAARASSSRTRTVGGTVPHEFVPAVERGRARGAGARRDGRLPDDRRRA